MKFLENFAPLAMFFILNARGAKWFDLPEDQSLFIATAGFMAALTISIGASLLRGVRPKPITWVSGGFVMIFGGLTLFLQDETFIKIKPTIVYLLFAAILFVGIWRGQSYLHSIMGDSLRLSQTGWMMLTRNWAWFFTSLALINEIAWRNLSTDDWVSFKVFGFLSLTLIFVLTQTLFLKGHSDKKNAKKIQRNSQRNN